MILLVTAGHTCSFRRDLPVAAVVSLRATRLGVLIRSKIDDWATTASFLRDPGHRRSYRYSCISPGSTSKR